MGITTYFNPKAFVPLRRSKPRYGQGEECLVNRARQYQLLNAALPYPAKKVDVLSKLIPKSWGNRSIRSKNAKRFSRNEEMEVSGIASPHIMI